MAWGMYLPRSGGPYGPYGNDEGPVDHYGDGWRHRLIAYYQEQMPQAQRDFYRHGSKYAFCVVDKFTYECGAKRPGPDDLPVTPIEDHEPLRFYQTEKHFNELASVISLTNRMWAVDEAVKRLVERLEPGLHQFYPVEMRSPRGKVYPVPYYVLVVGRWIESFSPEESSRDSFSLNELNKVEWHKFHGSKKEINGIALRKSVFDGAHLWRERGPNEWLICFSDALAADLAVAGLKLPKYYRMKSI